MGVTKMDWWKPEPRPKRSARLSVRLTDLQYQGILEYAQRKGKTVSEVVREQTLKGIRHYELKTIAADGTIIDEE